MSQHTQQGFSPALRDFLQQFRREVHRQQVFSCRVRKAATGIILAVGIADIGLDVKNRRTIHQIRSGNHQHRAIGGREPHLLQPDAT